MKAIILAAGRGSRMKSLTDEKPKCLVELRGKALLDWQISAIKSAGISEIAIVTGYKRELLQSRGLVEFHNSRWSETQMVSSLACAQDWLEGGPCLVSYSDIFYDSSAARSLIDCNAELAVTFDPNWLKLWEKRFGDPLLDAETFRMNDEGYLCEIGKKPKSTDEVQGQYMGLLRITPNGWNEICRIRSVIGPENAEKLHMTGTLQRVIEERQVPILAVAYNQAWGEIDSAEDLRAYEQ